MIFVEKILLSFLIFLFPAQLAYHFWPKFAYVFGLRIDYLSPKIYLTDIFIFLLLPFIVLRIRKFMRRFMKKPRNIFKYGIAAIFLGAYIALNIFTSANRPAAFIGWLTLGKMSVLGFYIFLYKLKGMKKRYVKLLCYSSTLFALIGISQFVLQRTTQSLLYYLGERSFTALTPGIALINLGGNLYLRAYSTFSHPNSFAGFLVLALILIYGLARKKPLKPFNYVFLLIIGTATLLSFSTGAFIGLTVVLVFYFVSKKLPHFSNVMLKIVFYASLLLSLFIVFVPEEVTELKYFQKEEVRDRVFLIKASARLFAKQPVLGIGLNNFVSQTDKHQPIHNLFLLILSELGIVGLACVFLISGIIIKKVSGSFFSLAIVFILVTGFFDHYWFTLQQNQLLFSFLLGLVFKKDISAKL